MTGWKSPSVTKHHQRPALPCPWFYEGDIGEKTQGNRGGWGKEQQYGGSESLPLQDQSMAEVC